jgi:hypothetical protein
VSPVLHRIAFRDGYKYQLVEPYTLALDLYPARAIDTPYVALGLDGTLTIRAGYAWDGPSGPTIDTPSFQRGALVHDALYQLIREGYLPPPCRAHADRLLRSLCREDGMSAIRAWWVYRAVRRFGAQLEVPVLYGKPE